MEVIRESLLHHVKIYLRRWMTIIGMLHFLMSISITLSDKNG